MKKFASFALYVSSIALAVGIGMLQVGKEYRQTESGADTKCPIVSLGQSDCGQIQGESTCDYKFSRAATIVNYESNYRNVSRSQCGTYNSEGQFTRYTGCSSEALTPTSDECGG
jgi:hypothetical protein